MVQVTIIITIPILDPHRADDQEVAQGDHQADEAQGHQRAHHLGTGRDIMLGCRQSRKMYVELLS